MRASAISGSSTGFTFEAAPILAPLRENSPSFNFDETPCMTNVAKQMLIGSIAVTGIVAALAVMDIVTGSPFSGQMGLDIMFLISAGLIGYMCFDTYKESK